MTSTNFFFGNDQGKFWAPVPVPQQSKTLSLPIISYSFLGTYQKKKKLIQKESIVSSSIPEDSTG